MVPPTGRHPPSSGPEMAPRAHPQAAGPLFFPGPTASPASGSRPDPLFPAFLLYVPGVTERCRFGRRVRRPAGQGKIPVQEAGVIAAVHPGPRSWGKTQRSAGAAGPAADMARPVPGT
ncbi:hypothetical protein GCM10010446_23910 [Streptomyces enissocaesilis]|uniref:Uncharacterized protein n=1 Tax=Streptomyces enissocaesilis TaxID=332589 RepID=A0ABN3X7H3_9ACTN